MELIVKIANDFKRRYRIRKFKIKSNFVFTVDINLELKFVSHALYETFKERLF